MRRGGKAVEPVRWDRLFLIIGSLLGLGFVVVTPTLGGVDEVTHFVRVSLISDGWIIAPSTTDDQPGPSDYAVDGCDAAFVYERWPQNAKAQTTDLDLDWGRQFRNPECRPPDSGLVAIDAAQNVYTPVPYVPALVGYNLGHAFAGSVGSLYGARLAQLAAYLALGWLAIRIIPWGKPLLFTIGLFPVAIHTASTISEDPITLGVALLFVASVLSGVDSARRDERLETRALVTLGLLASALTLCKSVYLPFVVLTLAIPQVAFGSRRRWIRTNAISIAAAAGLGAAWALGVVTDVRVALLNGADSIRGARWIRHHPMDFLMASVRGWTDRHEVGLVVKGLFAPVYRGRANPAIPTFAFCLWLILARLADPVPRLGRRGDPGVHEPVAERLNRKHRRLAVALAVIAAAGSLLLIEYGIAITVNPPGAPVIRWVQGRYLLPLLPLTLFGFDGVRSRIVPATWLRVLPVLSVISGLWWLWHVAHETYGWL